MGEIMLFGTVMVGAWAVANKIRPRFYAADYRDHTRTFDLLARGRELVCAICHLKRLRHGWNETRRRLSNYDDRLQADEKDLRGNHGATIKFGFAYDD